MSNGQVLKICRETDCHSVNVIYYLKCKMRKEKETIGDNTKGLRMNQYISDCKTAAPTCKFPRHVYECGIKNNRLEDPFFILNIVL